MANNSHEHVFGFRVKYGNSPWVQAELRSGPNPTGVQFPTILKKEVTTDLRH
jgi:hypothetical protein